jgi:hypothetical protein
MNLKNEDEVLSRLAGIENKLDVVAGQMEGIDTSLREIKARRVLPAGISGGLGGALVSAAVYLIKTSMEP